jgi:hypothetical protein
VLQGEFQPEIYPSQLIHPQAGTLAWLVDQDAANQINLKPGNEWTISFIKQQDRSIYDDN